MRDIPISITSNRKEVAAFLKKLGEILGKEDLDLGTDLILISKKKADDEEHSTPYTLADLEYDRWDVVERLKELTIEEYSETRLDQNNPDPPLLFVFGKEISGRLIYIKLKIKENQRGQVICVSFHYAREKMNYPYA